MKLWMFLCCFSAWELKAQQLSPAPFLGMGSVKVAQSGLYTLLGNPAGLTDLQTAEVALSYQQHYFLPDFASQGLLFGTPIGKTSSLGLKITNYGVFSLSSQVQSGISWTRKFGKVFSSSISLNHHQYYLAKYSNSHSYSIDLGFLYFLQPELALGFFFNNIGGSSFDSRIDQLILRELGLGLCYYLSEAILFGVDMIRALPGRIAYHAGLGYKVHPQYTIRVGSISNPLQYTAGFGLEARRWQVDVAASFHAKLGTSPQLGLRYAF